MGTAAATAAGPLMLIQPEAKPRRKFKSMRAAEFLKRTDPEIYRGADLRYIGMPVGGLFAGTVYLGGDGQLWNWDVFNQHHVGTVPNGSVTFMGDQLNEIGGSNYVEPPRQQSPFFQVFELLHDGRAVKFGDIAFRGEYPVGRVVYAQADADVEMELTAFSPFCPLDVESSSFPATTMTYRVKNVGQSSAEYQLRYRVNNPVLCYAKKSRADFLLQSRTTAAGGVEFSAKANVGTPPVPTLNSKTGRAVRTENGFPTGRHLAIDHGKSATCPTTWVPFARVPNTWSIPIKIETVKT